MRNINLRYAREKFNAAGVLADYSLEYPDPFNFGYDIVDDIAENEPDRVAMVWCNPAGEERIFTFADMKRMSDKTANFLREQGVKKGDMVWPDTIIGEAAKDENGNFCMELELYYLTPRPEGHRTRASYLRHYIDPLFSTTRGTIQLQKGKSYKAKANKKLIVKEK